MLETPLCGAFASATRKSSQIINVTCSLWTQSLHFRHWAHGDAGTYWHHKTMSFSWDRTMICLQAVDSVELSTLMIDAWRLCECQEPSTSFPPGIWSVLHQRRSSWSWRVHWVHLSSWRVHSLFKEGRVQPCTAFSFSCAVQGPWSPATHGSFGCSLGAPSHSFAWLFGGAPDTPEVQASYAVAVTMKLAARESLTYDEKNSHEFSLLQFTNEISN